MQNYSNEFNEFNDPDNVIGLCGVFCKGCPAYLIRCYGCRSNNNDSLQKRTSKWKCKKRLCVLHKNLNHCGECPEFSCITRKNLDKTYIKNYKIDLQENCRNIVKLGASEWISQQIQQFTCNICGNFFSPYDGVCKQCKG